MVCWLLIRTICCILCSGTLCETTMKEECRSLFLSSNKPHLKSLLSSFVSRFFPSTTSGSLSIFMRQRTISYKTPKTYQWKFTVRTICRLAITKTTFGPHTRLGHKWGHCVLYCRVSALWRGFSSKLLDASLFSRRAEVEPSIGNLTDQFRSLDEMGVFPI